MTRSAFSAIAALACLALPPSGAAQSLAERLETCAGCHGVDGRSVQPETPSLAGQPADYLMVQLFLFRENLRPGTVMTPFAQGLSDAELQELAAHFAGLEPSAPQKDPDPQAYARGAALAREHRCGSCHLADFSGAGQVPRLAGQREDYLAKALREYKSGDRPGYEPAMAEVMAPISVRTSPTWLISWRISIRMQTERSGLEGQSAKVVARARL